MNFVSKLLIALLLFTAPSWANDLPVLRLAVLKIGTVNWELDTITRNKLDEKYGFKLDVRDYADNGATRIAVQGGEADMAVADWIWVARQRAAGKDYVFIPYSKAVGGIVVPSQSPAVTLPDLMGAKIGIAGGPLDKSWLILRAYAAQEYGLDLKAETEQVYGAPPLIFKSALSAEFQGAVNFWHFLAKMKVQGMRELISVQTAAAGLGLNPETPLLGYYMRETLLAKHPDLGAAFYRASRDAKALLASSDAAWEALRPRMRADTDSQFEQLRTDWIAGIPESGPVDMEGANKLLALMNELGGSDLVGNATSVPDGLFLPLN